MMPLTETRRPADPTHVLIVEDDADTRDMYQELLTRSGFQVTLATNVPEALAHARRLRPDIITTDLGRDGALLDGLCANRTTETFSRDRSHSRHCRDRLGS
jgi:CheY-like chemotaxis protein